MEHGEKKIESEDKNGRRKFKNRNVLGVFSKSVDCLAVTTNGQRSRGGMSNSMS